MGIQKNLISTYGPRLKSLTKRLIPSLILGLWGCQTFTAQEDRSEEIYNSQKSIITSHIDSGNPQTAIKLLRPVMDEHPDDPDLFTLMGLAQMAQENQRQALLYFNKAYAADPVPHRALNLSSAMIESGDYLKATKLLQKVVGTKAFKTYKFRERLFHNIAYAAYKNRDYKKAENYYQRALEENPGFYLSHLYEGRLYQDTGRMSQARVAFDRASQACKICLEPVEILVTDYIQSGKNTMARKILQKYVAQESISKVDRIKANDLLSLVNRVSSRSLKKY